MSGAGQTLSAGGVKRLSKSAKVLRKMRKHWQIYLLILLPVVWYILFCYYPMAGLQLAFKNYRAKLGIWGSPWVGAMHFESLFVDPAFWRSIRVTVMMNLWKMLICFPAPIFLALIFNEMRIKKGVRALQTVFTFPNFLSWVVVAAIVKRVLAYDGPVNMLFNAMGLKTVSFLGNEDMFWPTLFISDIWKNVGYSSIMYMAALNGIDQSLYEAAEVDGADRFQRLVHITVPGIMPLVSLMLIMSIGGILSAGFDQIFNLQNPAVQKMADVLDIYIYRITFESTPNFGFSTAISLFRSVVNLVLLVVADQCSKKMGGTGLIAKAD